MHQLLEEELLLTCHHYFNDRSQWDVYKLQFEVLADVNHWSDAEKSTYRAVSL